MGASKNLLRDRIVALVGWAVLASSPIYLPMSWTMSWSLRCVRLVLGPLATVIEVPLSLTGLIFVKKQGVYNGR